MNAIALLLQRPREGTRLAWSSLPAGELRPSRRAHLLGCEKPGQRFRSAWPSRWLVMETGAVADAVKVRTFVSGGTFTASLFKLTVMPPVAVS